MAFGSFHTHPEDRPRFAENNIIAEFSPYLWFPSLVTGMLEVDIGIQRLELGFPVKDVIYSAVIEISETPNGFYIYFWWRCCFFSELFHIKANRNY